MSLSSIVGRKTFHGAVTAVINVETRCRSDEVVGRRFLPFLRFSTAAAAPPPQKPIPNDERFLLGGEYNVNSAEKHRNDDAILNSRFEKLGEAIPDGFPFEIEDIEGKLFLKRKYEDEIVKVELVGSSNPSSLAWNDDDAEDDFNYDVNANYYDDKKNDEKMDFRPLLSLIVSISKGDGHDLEFGVSAFHDRISINTWSIRNSEYSENQQPLLEGPDFHCLPGNLQKMLLKYLEIRGVDSILTRYLYKLITIRALNNVFSSSRWTKKLMEFLEN